MNKFKFFRGETIETGTIDMINVTGYQTASLVTRDMVGEIYNDTPTYHEMTIALQDIQRMVIQKNLELLKFQEELKNKRTKISVLKNLIKKHNNKIKITGYILLAAIPSIIFLLLIYIFK